MQNEPETHKSMYLIDGNMVITCRGSSKNAVAFRVHQSLLAKQSPIFEAMLRLPQGGSAPSIESYDGLPQVELPDGAREVESLLRILYHEV